MKRTAWYPADETKPVRKGWYEIQNKSLLCNCCYIDAYWDGQQFVRFGLHVTLRVREAFHNVTRWRGLTEMIYAGAALDDAIDEAIRAAMSCEQSGGDRG